MRQAFRETISEFTCFAGCPARPPKKCAEAILTVWQSGVRPHIAEYSPIPATPMWDRAVWISPFDISMEPLYRNNTFFACRGRFYVRRHDFPENYGKAAMTGQQGCRPVSLLPPAAVPTARQPGSRHFRRKSYDVIDAFGA